MDRIFFVAAFLIALCPAFAQLPHADFSAPTQVCLGERFELDNQSTNAARYEWDFCQGDLQLTPTAVALANLTANGANVLVGIDFIQDQGNWYGFVLSRSNSTLFRLNFGNNVNNTPSITTLGTLGNVLSGPQAIRVVKDGNNFFGLVSNLFGNRLVRLSFGSTITSVPVAEVLMTGVAPDNTGLDVAFDGTKWVLVLTNNFNLTIINFGTTLSNNPQPVDILETDVLAGSWVIGDVSLIYDGQWYGLAVSYNNAKLFRLDFGSSLFATPVVTDVTSTGLVPGFNPSDVEILYENDTYQAFITTLQGSIFRYTFGQHMNNDTPGAVNLSNFGFVNNTFKFDVVRDKGRYVAFITNWNANNIFKLTFPEVCTDNTGLHTEENVWPVQYSTSGTKVVSLFSYSATDVVSSMTKTILVTSGSAPAINFSNSGICSEHTTTFTPSASMQTYNWDFGDGNNSTAATPAHSYLSSGDFEVKLVASASNGCSNTVRNPVKIYNQPVASFTVPTGLLCTNNTVNFTNTTPDNYDGNLGYEWYVNGTLQLTTPDFTHQFTTPGDQNVKLVAAIPGCSSEQSQTVTNVVAGPHVAFSLTGQCEDDIVNFTNTTTGTVSGYSWDFGDGQTSTVISPLKVFPNPGVYDVVLTASNAAGCNNTASQQLTIYSAPQVNFAALAPPFSCSGTPTQFNDLTPPPGDSNLSSWLWNFGDTGSPSNTSAQKNPQHTYATAADYTVSLTVTTNFLCSKTFQKFVTIYQTPTAAFNHSALCEDTQVMFSDAASTNQAWSWQIESNFYSTENPEHVFSNPGNYDVILSVTGTNSCIGTTQQTVVIPPKLLVDFSSLRTCANQNTVFTDLTNDSSDPITDYHWNFGALESAETNPAIVVFPETGTVNVTLTVTTQSGCAFPVTKPIAITSGPLAAFTANPNEGEAPLIIQFVNNSLAANTFTWDFGDGAPLSALASPSNTYEVPGNYIVQLIATDLQSCIDTTHQVITVLDPSEINPPSPNPSTGEFTVEWPLNEAAKTSLQLIDATGRQIRNFEVMANAGINRYILDITGEQPGLYILKIRYLNIVKTYRLMLFE